MFAPESQSRQFSYGVSFHRLAIHLNGEIKFLYLDIFRTCQPIKDSSPAVCVTDSVRPMRTALGRSSLMPSSRTYIICPFPKDSCALYLPRLGATLGLPPGGVKT